VGTTQAGVATAADPFFNPLDPELIRDPYPAYRRLRDAHPVYWHQRLRAWVLTRFEECQAVLRDADAYTTDWRRIGIATPPTLLSLQTLDPPEQTPLRHLGLDALRAQDLVALERDARQRAERMLAGVAPHGTFDFVADFADRFTLGTITSLLGLPVPEEAEEVRWTRFNDDVDHSMDAGLEPDAEGPGLEARAWFNALVAQWLASPPESGLLAAVAAHRDRAGVPDEVLVNSVRAFFHAGFEVPSRFLGNAVGALLARPGSLATCGRTDSIDAAVEELVRFAGPVHAVSRACTRGAELGGTRINKGDIVIVLIAAANRDPDQFPDPDELVLDRASNPHLGFGRGTHSCLGNAVGRMQGRVVLSTLARDHPAIRLAGEPVRRPNATLRGFARLPVALRASERSG
jgi:cytochrome P450